MKVLQKPTISITPYARNPRDNAAAVSKVAASIKEFGWQQPIVVDSEMVIIAGHTRILAAQQLGLAKVPVVIASDLTPAQVKAYRLADNRTAQEADWDNELLGLELQDLEGLDFDMQLLGFDEDELANLMITGTEEGLTDPDDTPPLEDDAVTSPGDIWILGRHRLMCGDSTSKENVTSLMSGALAGLCFTSPPYGQQRDYTDASDCSDWDGLMQGVFGNLPMADDGQVLVNLGLIHRDSEWISYWDGWIEWMRGHGWRRFGWYVWDQGAGLPGNWKGRLAPSHEFIFHFNKESLHPNKTKVKKPENICKKNGTGLRQKDGTMSGVCSPDLGLQTHKIPDSVIRINRQQVEHLGHPAAFPASLPDEFMQVYPGAVYEPFSGSGTTIIAAEQTGRICYAIEIEPRYVDMAVRRWQEFTGEQATLEKTGKTFDDCVPVTNVE